MKSLPIIYIALLGTIFAAFCVIFNVMPRSVVSELEKRELAEMPRFSLDRLMDGIFTQEVSSWYSDTEPFRDQLMTLSMQVKDLIRMSYGEDNVTFHASTESGEQSADSGERMADSGAAVPDTSVANPLLNENAKIANAGIIVVGSGPNVRALMAYGGDGNGGVGYANAANKYKETFPQVNVYCMVIPMSTDFYIPEKVRKRSRSQRPTIDNVNAHLAPGVKAVDIYDILKSRIDEDIYLRTDHHWAPLGAYYAAKEFARVAGVPFRDLGSYDKHVIHGYVGSMYGYSKDIAVKNAPEDFVYYTPRGVNYTTTYINYKIDKDYRVMSESKPVAGPYFYKFKDGSGGAYCTFMGGDTKLTVVRTSTHNHRRLLIIKDSFGNAIPGYLFFSFEEVHVVDTRYFTRNMVRYVHDNQITDILFANNTFNAYPSRAYDRYARFLTQSDGVHYVPPKQEEHTSDVNGKTTDAEAGSSDVPASAASENTVPNQTNGKSQEPDTSSVGR